MNDIPNSIPPRSAQNGKPSVRSAASTRSAVDTRADPFLKECAQLTEEEVLSRLSTSLGGLSEDDAALRLKQDGPNAVAPETHFQKLQLVRHAVLNPLVILLAVLAGIEMATGEYRSAWVMLAMIVVSVVLRLVQEIRADHAATKLKEMVHITATVFRDGVSLEIPMGGLVRGDIVLLSAGDMVPADVRILRAKDLFVSQARLTGESIPLEKMSAPELRTFSLLDAQNVGFWGTSVQTGTGTAVVVATGPKTTLGRMAELLAEPHPRTSFDAGISRVTWLMIRFMFLMIPLVFFVNGLTKHDWTQAFFFSMAVAVGLTPEMFPMIVTVCLSKGALSLSKKKVVVKRLNAIQNFGAMDILCSDKTGTLTLDQVVLERHCDVSGEENPHVLEMAYLNSYFQTGLKNVLDRAILNHQEIQVKVNFSIYKKMDEIPFTFTRKAMSVVLLFPDGDRRIVCKGAPEEVFKRCTQFELDGEVFPIETALLQDLKEEYERLSSDGFRVLALATKTVEERETYSIADEAEMTLIGYVAFLDPPKESATAAIKALGDLGVTVKVLTGDNELVGGKICREVGIPPGQVLLGSDVEVLDDPALALRVEKTTLFARLSPQDKRRVVLALRSNGHVVGHLGDGINDALALRASDIGISVDMAVDVAKESADLILMEKDLMVLAEGVKEGRRVFSNIVKYVRMGASSNFGNMFSVIGASAFLPFLPMAPIQILVNNLLYDMSQIAIPTDTVDEEQIARPRAWSMGELTRFILFFGPISSLFDYALFFILLFVFKCWDPSRASLFQTGWFVESLLTQTLVIHIIRTRRIPFIQSRASWPLLLTTCLVIAFGVWLPYSSIASSLGMTELPPLYWVFLGVLLLGYLTLTQWVKKYLFKRTWS